MCDYLRTPFIIIIIISVVVVVDCLYIALSPLSSKLIALMLHVILNPFIARILIPAEVVY